MSSGPLTEQGILTIDAATYHSDAIADVPSLSASIAKLLINQSPAHAFAQHPRLNPHYVRKDDKKFDTGNVAHAIILEGKETLEVVKVIEGYDDWKKQKARDERDYWRGQGFIPLLDKDFFSVVEMVKAARRQLAEHRATPVLFADGKPEQTVTWTESGVHCKARIDWLHDDFSACDDLKTTARSAREDQLDKLIYGMSYDIQAELYVRAVRAATGIEPVFRFVFVETTPPYALSVATPSPAMYALASDRVDTAIRIWRECLASGEWPAYSRRVATIDPPMWAETQWMEREAA